MVQTQRMPIFVSGCRGMVQQVAQFEIPCIATQPVDGGNIMLGIFFDAEKIQSWIGIMPDGRRLKIGLVQPFDLE